MNAIPALGSDEGSRLARQVVGLFDAPACVRRARRVDDLLDGILLQARNKRSELVAIVRLRLATLAGLLGTWDRLELIGRTDALAILQELSQSLEPTLRLPQLPTESRWRLRRAYAELRESMQLFQRRWQTYRASLDRGPLNQAIADYNRYYVLEKK